VLGARHKHDFRLPSSAAQEWNAYSQRTQADHAPSGLIPGGKMRKVSIPLILTQSLLSSYYVLSDLP
jgi:hypothetical protein